MKMQCKKMVRMQRDAAGTLVRLSRKRRQRSAMAMEALEGRTLFSVNSLVVGTPLFSDSGFAPTYVISGSGPAASYTATDFSTWHDGVLWTTHGDTITRQTLNGSASTVTVPQVGGQQRAITSNIVFTQDDTAWFVISQNNQSRLETLAADGTFADISGVQTSQIPGMAGIEWRDASAVQISPIWHLAVAGDDSLWYTQGEDILGHIANGQTSTLTLAMTNGFSGMTTASDGAVWVTGDTSNGGGFADRIAPGDVTPTVFTLGDPPSNPAEASDGSIYFGGVDAINKISPAGVETRISLPGITAVGLTVAADGAVWFIDRRNTLNPIARLGSDGSVLHIAPAGAAGTRIESLTLGPDGALYTLDSDGLSARLDVNAGLLGQGVQITAPAYKQSWSFVVGSLTDTQLPGQPSDYAATIDWGDGQSSAGTLAPNAAGGFDIVGTHAFSAWAWRVVSVHVTDLRAAEARTVDFHSVAYVIPPGMAGGGLTINATAGQTFSGPVAVYTGIDPDALDQYTVNINWGDGESSTGQLVPGANGETQVVGSHVYLHSGGQALTITVSQLTAAPPGAWNFDAVSLASYVISIGAYRLYDGGSATQLEEFAIGRAEVGIGQMDGALTIGGAVEGVPVTESIAHFTWAGTAGDLTHLHAAIDWGDGRVTADAPITAAADGFEVGGELLYIARGTYRITVSVADDRIDNPTVGVIRQSLNVYDHLAVAPQPVLVAAGQAFSGLVATVSSAGFANWSATMVASIQWGDGTTSAGTVVAGDQGIFYIYGTHTYDTHLYETHGSFCVGVYEARTPLDPTWSTPGQPYFSGALGQYRLAAEAVDSVTLFNVNEAHSVYFAQQTSDFILAGAALPAGMAAEDVTGSVTWDDGQTTPIRVQAGSPYSNGGTAVWAYMVLTTVTFATAGTHHGVLTITSGDDSQQVDVEQSVGLPQTPVPWVPIGTTSGGFIKGYKGQSLSGVVTHFVPNPLLPFDPVQATVSISWGDDTQSSGILVAAADGGYDVVGSHTFETLPDASGRYYLPLEIYVTITTAAGSVEGATLPQITLDPTRIDLDPVATIDYRQRETFTATLGKFTPPRTPAGSAAGPDDFTATINWGDGFTSAGVIIRNDDGTFEVAGTHKYQVDGYENWTLTVDGPGGPVSTYGTLYLIHNSIVITPISDVATDENGIVSGTFAHFVDEDPVPFNSTVLYVAQIDWGDGQVSDAQILATADGGYDVKGTHMYATDGDFDIKLIVRRNVRDLPGLAAESITDFASRDTAVLMGMGWVDNIPSYNNSASLTVTNAAGGVTEYHSQIDTGAQGAIGRFHINRGTDDSPFGPIAGDPSTTPQVVTPTPDFPISHIPTPISLTAAAPAVSGPISTRVAAGILGLSASDRGGTATSTTSLPASTSAAGTPDAIHALPSDPEAPVNEDHPATGDPATFQGEFRLENSDAPAVEGAAPEPPPAAPDDLLQESFSSTSPIDQRASVQSAVLGESVIAPHFLVIATAGSAPHAAEANASMMASAGGNWWKILALTASLVGIQLHRPRRAARYKTRHFN